MIPLLCGQHSRTSRKKGEMEMPEHLIQKAGRYDAVLQKASRKEGPYRVGGNTYWELLFRVQTEDGETRYVDGLVPSQGNKEKIFSEILGFHDFTNAIGRTCQIEVAEKIQGSGHLNVTKIYASANTANSDTQEDFTYEVLAEYTKRRRENPNDPVLNSDKFRAARK